MKGQEMDTFEQYLALHEIDPISLSIEAKVRYLTIHNAQKGNPITEENAKRIKSAVLRLTGEPYNGPFAIRKAPPSNQLPVIPVRQLHSQVRQATPYAHRYCRSSTGS
jgi:hypothetical protein